VKKFGIRNWELRIGASERLHRQVLRQAHLFSDYRCRDGSATRLRRKVTDLSLQLRIGASERLHRQVLRQAHLFSDYRCRDGSATRLRREVTDLSLRILLGMTLLLSSCSLKEKPDYTDRVVSVPVAEIPFRNVEDPVWKNAPLSLITLQPQRVVAPMIQSATVPEIRIRSIHDRNWIAFLLEWEDLTKDTVVDVDRFSDQVAVQFPLDPASPPSFTMGHKEGRVQIIHWKAIWQDDIEKGYRDVATIHPDYWVDMYYYNEKSPYGEGETGRDMKIEQFKSPEALNYMPGAYSKNPVTVLDRQEPVEEAMAEGYGTFTSQPIQNARGWGKWEDGVWKVIIARPFVTNDPNDAPISIGSRTLMAFAVWDGGEKNVGSRKNYSVWMDLQIRN